MEELIEYLSQSAKEVDGVQMVPLDVAVTVLTTYRATSALEELTQTIAGLYESLAELPKVDEDGEEV